MANLSAIKLPNGTTYNLKDNGALQLTGGSVTGPVSFGDSVSIDEANVGDLVVNGSASFTNNIQANTINDVVVGANPKFTDTTYSLSGALSSHKFTSTLTAGGSGSGTSTSDFTLAAGSNIGLTDDTTNRKITIAWIDEPSTGKLKLTAPTQTSWVYQRDYAQIARDAQPSNAMYPFIDMKTENGDWAIATYGENLWVSYVSDEKYEAGTNQQEGFFELYSNGNIRSKGTITAEDHSSPIGSLLTASTSTAITAANIDTYAQGPSLSIPAGSWIITGDWQFNSATGTTRNLNAVLSTSSGTSTSGTLAAQRVVSAGPNWARLEVVYIGTFDATTTVYLKGSSSVAHTAQTQYIRAMRIA